MKKIPRYRRPVTSLDLAFFIPLVVGLVFVLFVLVELAMR